MSPPASPQLVRMIFRSARPSDARRLTAIALAAKRHWGYPEEWLRMWREELTVTADRTREWAVWCAEVDGTVVGFCALSGEPPDGELEHLWVEPDSMGRGVGSGLFAHALETAAESGIQRLRIASDPHAEGFYLGRGARRIGSVPSTPAGRRLPLLEVRVER
jgi:N-acetylglutamate synthase-like GNAT family acetyltransferase